MPENEFTVDPPPFPERELKFLEDLKSWKIPTPHWSREELPGKEYTDFRKGFTIERSFPDPEGLLTSVYEHLERFRAALHAFSGPVVKAELSGELRGESFRLKVTEEGAVIEAGNTEGARRGLYYFEDALTASPGAFLPRGVTEKNCWLKNRISRCFFGPIKRPPFNRDELLDEIDYYPEPYLDRLAKEGVNGLWLTIVFREICRTSFLPEDPQAGKRREKLRKSVEKCRKYGIKLWVFAIEPAAWGANNPLPPGLPAGPAAGLLRPFCPASEASEKYLYESTNSLFREVPHLGGLLLISHGERLTSCLGGCSPAAPYKQPCGEKCKLSIGEIFARTLKPMRRGMADASKEAEMISWLYQPYPQQVNSWVYQFPAELTEDITLAYNFESGCNKEQLGKVRTGGDYWLSCVGPAERFGRMAEAARGKCGFAAKLQVGCSHEVATIPFVPVPGLLYRKYKQMRACNVTSVIQCWYFGNYPGTMNHAAGLLAYEDFKGDELSFLKELAAPEWGKRAREVAEIWQALGRAYENYPLGYEFQYYGPAHDGAVWPLHLKNVLRRLPRTWKPDHAPAGDAVGEFLNNFDLGEIVVLTGRLASSWNEAWKKLESFLPEFKGDRERELDGTLIEALDCHFSACADIAEFYFRRNRMLNGIEKSSSVLPILEKILLRQIKISCRLAELCEIDPRLGYHSEAEVYKYFPAKLLWRSAALKYVLEKELPALKRALAEGKTPGELLEDPTDAAFVAGVLYKGDSFSWKAEREESYLRIDVEVEKMEEPLRQDGIACFIGDRLASMRPWNLYGYIYPVPSASDTWSRDAAIAGFTEKERTVEFVFRIPLALLPDGDCCRIGFRRWTICRDKEFFRNCPPGNYDQEYRLQHDWNSPEKMKKLQF